MRNGIRAILLSVGLFALPLTATHAGPYIGASWGAYQIEESDLDDNDDLWKVYGGTTIAGIFGVEVSRVDFSRVGSGTSSFEGDGWGLSGVLSFPVGGNSIFVKAGQFWWDSESGLGGAVQSRDGDDPFFGAGIKFGQGLGLRLEWERYDIADIDLDTYSIGLQFGF